MKKAISVLLTFILICGMVVFAPAANSATTPDDPIDITAAFEDPNFLSAVRTLIGKPTGPIYDTDVNLITTLEVNNSGISSLAGIEYFTSLSELRNC